MPDTAKPILLALVRDLIFASRISAAAQAAGIESRTIRDPSQLAGQIAPLLLVDLNLPGAIEAAATWRQTTSTQVIGFVSHVDAPTIAKARQFNLDRILARSAFVDQLPQILAAFCDRAPSSS